MPVPFRLTVNGHHLADLPTPDVTRDVIVGHLERHGSSERDLARARGLTAGQVNDDDFQSGEDDVLVVQQISQQEYRPEPV